MNIKRLVTLINVVCSGLILAMAIILFLSQQPRLAHATGSSYVQPDGVDLVITEEIFNPQNGHYYNLVELQGSSVNWFEARDAAAAMEYNNMPGHLATVTSQQEEDFITSNFPEIYPQYVWIGASDEVNEGDWKWITGEAWDYTDWAIGEPNNEGGNENCLQYGDYQQWWNDANCYHDWPRFYLVEYSATNVYLPLITR